MVFLDIETTGTNKNQDKILEIAIIKTDESYNIINTFETLINPEIEISDFIKELTGINKDMIINSPKIDEIKNIIQDLCSNDIIIGHNISFDIDFLIKKNINITNYYLVDTYFLSHLAFNDLFNYSQEYIANYLGLSYTAHRAMIDAQINYQIFLQIIDKLKLLDKKKIKQVINVLKKYDNYTGYKKVFSYIIQQNKKQKTYDTYNLNKYTKTNSENNNVDIKTNDNLHNIISDIQNNDNKVIIYETSNTYTKEIVNKIISKNTEKILIIDENQSLADIYSNNQNIQYLNHLSIYKVKHIIRKLKNNDKLDNSEIQLLVKLILFSDHITNIQNTFKIKFTNDELSKLNNLLNNKNNVTLKDKILNEIKKTNILIAKYDTILTKNNILNLFDKIIIINIDELFNHGITYAKYNINFNDIKDDINKKQNITSINIYLNKFKKILHESFMLNKNTNVIIYDDIQTIYKDYIKEKIKDLYTKYTHIFKSIKKLHMLYNTITNKNKIITIENNNGKLLYNVYTKNPLYYFNYNIKKTRAKIIGFSNSILLDKIDIKYNKYKYLQIKTNNIININQMIDIPSDSIKDLLYRYLCNIITLLSEQYNNLLILFNQKYDIKAIYNILTTKKEELKYNFFAQGIYGAVSKHQLNILKNINKKNVLMITYDYFINQKWEDLFDAYILFKLPVDMSYYTYYKIWTKENKIPFDEFINKQKILQTKKIFDIISSKKNPNIFSTDLILKENIQLIKKNTFLSINYNEISLRDIIKN